MTTPTTRLNNLIDIMDGHDLICLPGVVMFIREDVTSAQLESAGDFLYECADVTLQEELEEKAELRKEDEEALAEFEETISAAEVELKRFFGIIK